MADKPERVRAFDWLRGLAVLVMIQCHAMALLYPALRGPEPYPTLVWIDGLVAPSFILAAGFSLALVQVRAAMSADAAPGARARRFKKTLRRVGEVLAVGALMQWMWFPLLHEPKWLLRIDILPCIGLSLLIALPIFSLLASRPRALQWTALALAALVFGVAPYFENAPPLLAHFVSHKSGSMFPLLPWAGYVYLGAAIGAATARGGVRAAALWMSILGAVGIAIWLLTPQFQAMYPPHEFWITNPANHARRLVQVCGGTLVLLALEHLVRGAWQRTVPVRLIEIFGTSSLAGYFYHESLLYYRIGGVSFHALWGDHSTWARYCALTALLIAMTLVLAWATDKVYRRVDRRLTAPAAP